MLASTGIGSYRPLEAPRLIAEAGFLDFASSSA